MNKDNSLHGMRGFTLIWFGQLVSLFGTGMTRFAITIWAYTQTESATVLTLATFFSFAPLVIFSPIAGALVDRWDRKMVLMLSDFVAGLTTVVLLLLFLTGRLEIWHLYALGAIASSFEAFQFPAFSAAITMMLDKEQYTRASGMLSTAQSAATIAAPILAGILLGFADLGLVLGIDIATFLVAVGLIWLVEIPQPAETAAGQIDKGSIWRESIYGFRYIWERPSLLAMQMMFLQVNFFFTFGIVLLAPAVLARTGNNELLLGTVQSAAGIGGLAGGLVVSIWGGPKNKVYGVLLSMIGFGLCGHLVFGLGQNIVWWSIGAFCAMFFIPIMNGSNQALWQAKVAPDVQGRVFATRRLLAQITFPLATLIAGPLADQVFEPAMQTAGTSMASIFGWLVGTGPGAGISLIIIFAALTAVMGAVCGFFIPAVRDFDTRLPDHQATAESVAKPISAQTA